MADTKILQVQGSPQGEPTLPDWPVVNYGGNPPKRKTDGGKIALDWRAVLAVPTALLIIGVPLALWYAFGYCKRYDQPCERHGDYLFLALGAFSLTAAVLWLYTKYQVWQAHADGARNESRVQALRPNRYGQDVHILVHEAAAAQVLASVRGGENAPPPALDDTLYMLRDHLDRQLEERNARWKIYSGIEQLNEGAKTEIKTDLGAPPALPAPVEASGLSEFQKFWARMQDATHIGIFGQSRHGKSTLARAFMRDCVERGELVMGISLAADRVDWPIPMIGDGGEPMIVQALDAIRAEMTRRENARERDGQPIRVFVDELTSATADKAVYQAWEHIMSSFMTRSRHVGMYLVVMAHDNTSGVFATAGKARLIRNFMQVWAIKENGKHIIRIDDGLTIDATGRQVRQVWQLDETAPILALERRGGAIPASAVFLTEDDLTPAAPKPTRQQAQEKAIRAAIAQRWSRDRARAAGLTFDNNLWTRLGGQ